CGTTTHRELSQKSIVALEMEIIVSKKNVWCVLLLHKEEFKHSIIFFFLKKNLHKKDFSFSANINPTRTWILIMSNVKLNHTLSLQHNQSPFSSLFVPLESFFSL